MSVGSGHCPFSGEGFPLKEGLSWEWLAGQSLRKRLRLEVAFPMPPGVLGRCWLFRFGGVCWPAPDSTPYLDYYNERLRN